MKMKMKTQNNISQDNQKRKYTAPKVEQVLLDNEISMVMMSPPVDPGSGGFMPFFVPNMSIKKLLNL
jgi:hypothetical protein